MTLRAILLQTSSLVHLVLVMCTKYEVNTQHKMSSNNQRTKVY